VLLCRGWSGSRRVSPCGGGQLRHDKDTDRRGRGRGRERSHEGTRRAKSDGGWLRVVCALCGRTATKPKGKADATNLFCLRLAEALDAGTRVERAFQRPNNVVLLSCPVATPTPALHPHVEGTEGWRTAEAAAAAENTEHSRADIQRLHSTNWGKHDFSTTGAARVLPFSPRSFPIPSLAAANPALSTQPRGSKARQGDCTRTGRRTTHRAAEHRERKDERSAQRWVSVLRVCCVWCVALSSPSFVAHCGPATGPLPSPT
jgi:hypothetical protein